MLIPFVACLLVGSMITALVLTYRDVKAMDARIKHFDSKR